MKLENQVTSLELSKKLKKLGVKQESIWYWCFNTASCKYELRQAKFYAWDGDKKRIPYSAFTVAELFKIVVNYITLEKYPEKYEARRHNDYDSKQSDTNPTNALAKMLIYLIKNKLIAV